MQVASKFTHGISYFVFNVESIGSMYGIFTYVWLMSLMVNDDIV